MPISRSKEGRCAAGFVCLAIGRSDGITALVRPVGHLFTVSQVFDTHNSKDADGPHCRRCFASRARMCLVAQKSSPAVCRAEGGYRSTGVFRIYDPRSHRDEARRVRDDLDKVIDRERGRGLVAHLAYGEQLIWGRK